VPAAHGSEVVVETLTMNTQAERIARIVAGAFVVAGLAWVLLTDIALYYLVNDPVLIARLETAKGWIFVAVGAVLVYVVTLRSARRLAHAQATLSAVLDSIGDGLLLLGSDGAICRANGAAERMLRCADLGGLDAREFSRRFRVSYPNGSLVRPEDFVSQRAFREAGPLRYKAVLHPLRGAELVVSVTAAAVRSSDEDPVRMVVSVMHDITAAEHLERLRDQFLAAAAHTLKTPVAIIKANAQAILAGETTRLAQASRAIDRQCARIDRLVQNLLVLSRVRSESLELFMQELDLAPMIERIASEIARRSAPGNPRAQIEALPRVHADRERLELAHHNLIEDRARSAQPGSAITVTLTQPERDAVITVSCDCGPVSDEHPTAAAEFDDLSIGRLVSETIVRAHGGNLWEKRDESEATSWVSLPALDGVGTGGRRATGDRA